jgi:hypothetical protein
MSDGFPVPREGELLLALLRLAIAPAEAPAYRLSALRRIVAEAAKAGDQEGVDLAVREGVGLLRDSHEGGASKFDVPWEAYLLGQEADSVGLSATAREVYEVGLAGMGEDELSPDRGPLWMAIGDAWCKEGDEGKGLQSYREAVAAHRLSSIPINRLAGLASLIEAEARASRQENLESLIGEGIEVVEAMEGSPPEEDLEVVAHHFGRVTEAVRRPTLARRAYELTLDLLGEGSTRLPPAVVWQDIGDTWLAENNGPRALAAFRRARENPLFLSPAGRFVLLSDLAPAELHWGERAACETAVSEAAELLDDLPLPAPAGVREALTALAEMSEHLGRSDLAEAFAGRQEQGDEGASVPGDLSGDQAG